MISVPVERSRYMAGKNAALIMAGGEGTRFWPFSTPEFPKQFLDIFLGRSMLRITFERINKLIDIDDIFVITNRRYEKITRAELPELPAENILLEPEKRNTFPAISYFTYRFSNNYPDGSVIVLAADHIINNEVRFLDICKQAFTLAEGTRGIVTLGILPDRPETNYGYLFPHKYEETQAIHHGYAIEFIEKPDLQTAVKYLKSGGYFWNSGIFTFPFNTFINETEKISPRDHGLLMRYAKEENDIDELFKEITADSVDYMIMERSDNIKMLKAEFGWDDVGNWEALFRLRSEKDNMVLINAVTVNCSNSIIVSKDIQIRAVGMHDTVFVVNGDKILLSSLKGLAAIKSALASISDYDLGARNITVKGFKPEILCLDVEGYVIEKKSDGILIRKTV